MRLFSRNRAPKVQRIFKYFDGTRERSADPVTVIRKMAAHPKFDVDRHLADMVCGEPGLEAEASEISVQATREIFGIPAWTEDTPEGLTEMETLGVLNDFVLYVDNLKKNGSGQPT